MVEEHFVRTISLTTIAETQADANAPRDLLFGISLLERLAARPGLAEGTHWDRRVLQLDENSP